MRYIGKEFFSNRLRYKFAPLLCANSLSLTEHANNEKFSHPEWPTSGRLYRRADGSLIHCLMSNVTEDVTVTLSVPPQVECINLSRGMPGKDRRVVESFTLLREDQKGWGTYRFHESFMDLAICCLFHVAKVNRLQFNFTNVIQSRGSGV